MPARRGKNKPKGCVSVRPARPADAEAIAALSAQLGYPVSRTVMATLINKVKRRTRQKIYVAVLEGTVVGWLEICLPLSVLNAGKAEIGALVVDSQTRGAGVGTALMDAAHDWARQQRSPFVYLRSNIVRKDAHAFYTQRGYRVLKTQFVFKRNLDSQHLRKPS